MERLTYTAECKALMKNSEYIKYEADKRIAELARLPAEAAKNSKDGDGSEFAVRIEAAHKQACDKLIAELKSGFFDAKVMGYFASHPETKERTAKFKK
jgi:hypothetical protein